MCLDLWRRGLAVGPGAAGGRLPDYGVYANMVTSFLALSLVFQRGQVDRFPLRPGDKAPVFELKLLGKDETFALKSNFGKRPTVLIFGSYT